MYYVCIKQGSLTAFTSQLTNTQAVCFYSAWNTENNASVNKDIGYITHYTAIQITFHAATHVRYKVPTHEQWKISLSASTASVSWHYHHCDTVDVTYPIEDDEEVVARAWRTGHLYHKGDH